MIDNGIVSRAYNSFQRNHYLGTILKISDDAKLLDEMEFYRLIPSQCAIHFPRLVSTGQNYLEIEYYDYLTLGDYLVGATDFPLSHDEWDDVMANLYRLITDHWRVMTDATRLPARVARREMYVTKTEKEIARFERHGVYPELFLADELTINNVKYANFHVLWPLVKQYIESTLTDAPLNFMHGDLCFGNILYGLGGTLRFIDPRGSFGYGDLSEKGVLGDSLYDVAKLFHSVDGGYEFLNHGKFKIDRTGITCFTYSLDSTAPWRPKDDALEAFQKYFYPTYDERLVTLISALIFLGAAGRHYESAPRQLALYLVGIEQLNCAAKLGASV